MKKNCCFLWILLYPCLLSAQFFTPGWEGNQIIANEKFLNTTQWICNQSSMPDGDSCFVTSDTALHLHWYYGAGTRSKFAQVYLPVSAPVDLSTCDIFGLSIKGMQGSNFTRTVELKFESKNGQAVYTWENLAHINRWCKNLVVLKNQFSNYQVVNWDSIMVISFAITMNGNDLADNQADSGIVSFHALISQSVDSLLRAEEFEPLDFLPGNTELDEIRLNAARAIMNRQNTNGLLTTWLPDGSSWLYGQGLALRVLTEEGIWNDNTPSNDFALAAEKLATFLAGHQAGEGYWPRAWNALSGNIIVNLEGDNTVWMGDFPWIPGSLANYYRKSGDASVLPAIHKAKTFLFDLIEPGGKVNTMNMINRQKSEVSNYEGYAAVLYCLLELGDTVRAGNIMEYVMSTGWDPHYKLWKEGPGSSRPVLLVNTWLASIASSLGYNDESLSALSLIGKLLYTCGPGEPYGFDGVGPIATWYEGTLSYIASFGPASNQLFTEIKDNINADGTVPAYNDNLGAMAGIWAVDWSSLDATSWLYFAAAQQQGPFGYSGADTNMFTSAAEPQAYPPGISVDYYNDRITFARNGQSVPNKVTLALYDVSGMLLGSCELPGDCDGASIHEITRSNLIDGNLYLLVVKTNNLSFSKKIVYSGLQVH